MEKLISIVTLIMNMATMIVLWSILKKDDSGNRPIDVYLRMLFKD